MTCSHYVDRSGYETKEDYWTGETYSEWVTHSESTCVDIDLHRYKCTQCGEIGYYSGRARQHYEEGKKFPGISGLE